MPLQLKGGAFFSRSIEPQFGRSSKVTGFRTFYALYQYSKAPKLSLVLFFLPSLACFRDVSQSPLIRALFARGSVTLQKQHCRNGDRTSNVVRRSFFLGVRLRGRCAESGFQKDIKTQEVRTTTELLNTLLRPLCSAVHIFFGIRTLVSTGIKAISIHPFFPFLSNRSAECRREREMLK